MNTRKEVITQKLYGIEALAHNARKRYDNHDLCQKYIREIMQTAWDLWLLWNTEERKGQECKWWE